MWNWKKTDWLRLTSEIIFFLARKCCNIWAIYESETFIQAHWLSVVVNWFSETWKSCSGEPSRAFFSPLSNTHLRVHDIVQCEMFFSVISFSFACLSMKFLAYFMSVNDFLLSPQQSCPFYRFLSWPFADRGTVEKRIKCECNYVMFEFSPAVFLYTSTCTFKVEGKNWIHQETFETRINN